jgi:hypothetical protein
MIVFVNYPAVSMTPRDNPNFSNDDLDFLGAYEAICETAGCSPWIRALGGIVGWKKNRGSKISWHCPFNNITLSVLVHIKAIDISKRGSQIRPSLGTHAYHIKGIHYFVKIVITKSPSSENSFFQIQDLNGIYFSNIRRETSGLDTLLQPTRKRCCLKKKFHVYKLKIFC